MWGGSSLLGVALATSVVLGGSSTGHDSVHYGREGELWVVVGKLPRRPFPANYEVTGGGVIDLSFVRVVDDPLGAGRHGSQKAAGAQIPEALGVYSIQSGECVSPSGSKLRFRPG